MARLRPIRLLLAVTMTFAQTTAPHRASSVGGEATRAVLIRPNGPSSLVRLGIEAAGLQDPLQDLHAFQESFQAATVRRSDQSCLACPQFGPTGRVVASAPGAHAY